MNTTGLGTNQKKFLADLEERSSPDMEPDWYVLPCKSIRMAKRLQSRGLVQIEKENGVSYVRLLYTVYDGERYEIYPIDLEQDDDVLIPMPTITPGYGFGYRDVLFSGYQLPFDTDYTYVDP